MSGRMSGCTDPQCSIHRPNAPTDTELLDALEHYAWRVTQVDRGAGWTIQVDAYGGAMLGKGDTVRGALIEALEAVSRAPSGEARGA